MFERASIRNDKYIYIIKSSANPNYINLFWNKIQEIFPNIIISDDLKALYIQMISFRAIDRPSIQDIYNSEWMKEIRLMNKEQLNKLELEVKEEFSKREKEIIKEKQKKMNVEKQKANLETSSGNRSINDEINLFSPDISPNYAKTGLNMNYYIKITGKMEPNKFMNELITKIKNNYKNNCDIEPSKTEIKFRIYLETKNDEHKDFSDDEKEELKNIGINVEEETEDDDNIKGKAMIMEIKIFESYNGGYLLTFEKIEGNKNNFLDNIKTISSLVQNII